MEPWRPRPRETTRRGAELRALRRPAPPLAEPRPAARPRRPQVESWGIGLPGQYEAGPFGVVVFFFFGFNWIFIGF